LIDVQPTVTRVDFLRFLAIPTRWMDNDNYGHVNNVVYYSYFDTVVNEHLIREGGLDVRTGPVIGLVVETCCRFHRPLSFPGVVDAGIRVAKLGNSSVKYEIGLFAAGESEPAATGHFVHVWVDRATNRPAGVPEKIRAALAPLLVQGT
jgi:acyl-CoA thioester hydrolase